MKNNYITITIASIALSITMAYFNLDISSAFDRAMTFISILMGFSITSLSIIATSNFSKKLYKKEDPKNNSKTLLHNLIDFFKKSIYLSVITACFILSYSFFPKIPIKIISIGLIEISYQTVIQAITFSLFMHSLIVFISLFNLFSKFIIQNSKIP